MIHRRAVLGCLLVVVAAVSALAGCRHMASDGSSEVLASTSAATDIRALDLLAIKAAMGQYQKGDVEKIDAAVKDAVGSRWPTVATYVSGDIMVTVASSDTEVAYIVRGTELGVDVNTGALNLMRDVYSLTKDVGKASDDGSGDLAMHAATGFLSAAQTALLLLDEKGELDRQKDKQPIFIGHSLGGAAAQLLVLELRNAGRLPTSPGLRPLVFTYGAPVAGNRQLYRALFAIATVRKFYHPDDFVPRVPFDAFLGLISLVLPKDYYVTNDLNVVTGRRREEGEFLTSVTNPGSHLQYAESLGALADAGTVVDTLGGQVYAPRDQNKMTTQLATQHSQTLTKAIAEPAVGEEGCLIKHYQLQQKSGYVQGAYIKKKGGLSDASGMCWNLCKSPGVVEVNGDASAARNGVAQAYAQWKTECKDFTPLPQQHVIDACRSCMGACLTIGGYAWDQGTGANDKLKWCTKYAKDLQQ